MFAVYLDDFSNELNNIKEWCYIGKVLSNHLMFADDICIFCPSVRWLQRMRDVCQTYAESHGMIFNCNKTVCMTFKAKSAKITATPVLKLGGQYVKSVDQCKYLGILLDTELSDDKDIQRQLNINIVQQTCDINIVQQTTCEPLFPVVQMQLKTYFFVPFVRPCMHLNYGVISGSHACRDCG